MSQAAKDNNLCPRCHRGPLHTHQESGRCIVCAHLSDEDVTALQAAKQNAIFRPCPKCGCEKIKTGDCGYSSFNPGWAVCEGCGYKVSISICSGASDPAITTAWNEPALFEAKAAVAWLKEQVAERGAHLSGREEVAEKFRVIEAVMKGFSAASFRPNRR